MKPALQLVRGECPKTPLSGPRSQARSWRGWRLASCPRRHGSAARAVVVAGDSAGLRAVLVPVYEALGIDWEPATVGSVEDEVQGVFAAALAEVFLAALRERFRLAETPLDAETLALAETLEPRHRVARTI